MTIDEAIKRLEIDGYPISPRGHNSYQEAKKLGIEALKYYEAIKIHAPKYKESCLPGETSEVSNETT